MFGRSPLSLVTVGNANALNPNEITCIEDEILQEKISAILKHFLKLKIFSPPNCHKALEQYTQFVEEVKRVNSHELRLFETWEAILIIFTSKGLI